MPVLVEELVMSGYGVENLVKCFCFSRDGGSSLEEDRATATASGLLTEGGVTLPEL